MAAGASDPVKALIFLYNSVNKQAVLAKTPFKLTLPQFAKLALAESCHLCHRPRRRFNERFFNISVKEREPGYTVENTQAICWLCYRAMKYDLAVDEYLSNKESMNEVLRIVDGEIK